MEIEKKDDFEKVMTITFTGNYIKFKYTPQYHIAGISFSDNLVKVFKNNNFFIQWHQSPTGNCQISSFIEFNALLNRLLRDYNGYVEYYEAKQILKCIIAEIFIICTYNVGYDKRQLLLDINEEHLQSIKELFPLEWFKIEQPYESTNGSDMVMLLIVLKHKDLQAYWNVDVSKEFVKKGETTEEVVVKEVKTEDSAELPF